MKRALHMGDLRIEHDGRFKGMVNGTLTVAAGVRLDMAGMINGDLVIEPDSTVVVTGMINGEIINRGGHVDMAGMANS